MQPIGCEERGLSKIFAIGDIHGEFDMLRTALYALRDWLEPGDTVVFLGDYIDRGPDSRLVIKRLRAWREEWPGTVFLRGNHDQLLLEAFGGFGSSEECWLANGGITTLRSYGREDGDDLDWREYIPKMDLDFLLDTKYEYAQDLWRFVHAGVPMSDDLSEDQANWMRLWIRDGFIESERDFGAVVVFGHTIQSRGVPLIMANKIGIDTGAFRPGGCLTCAVLDAGEPNRLQYFQVTHKLGVYDFDLDISDPGQPSAFTNSLGLSASTKP